MSRVAAALDAKTAAIAERIRNSLVEKQQLGHAMQAATKLYTRRMRALNMFRPFPYQDHFLICNASEVLVQGGTRSGKSTIIAAAIAAYALNEAIYTSFGVPLLMRPERYRHHEKGEIWIIGKQTNHSRTIYRLLFEPGLFQMVRDKHTNQWRALQPLTIPGDKDIPESEWRPSPPLIYPSEVEFGWESKKEKMWKTATLPNGWTLCFYPSSGEPKRGDPVHRIWIDEEIESDLSYYAELQSRLSDYRGRIWWSSWPAIKCSPLLQLYHRAMADQTALDKGEKKALDVARFCFVGSDNPIIDAEEKRKRSEGWDEATRRARDLGQFVVDTIQTYPEFNRQYHAVDYGEGNPLNDKVTHILRQNNWVPPANWRVDLILDPGTSNVGLLWGAIPPPELWEKDTPYYIIFREYTGRYNAHQIALHVKNVDPGRNYCQWVIDGKAGDQTPMGYQYQVSQNYSQALAAQGLRCQLTGDMFIPGSPVWITRSMKLRTWMTGNAAGRPKFRIVTHMCPELCRQFESNVRTVQKEDVQDKPAPGQRMDLLVCAEYWASIDPVYILPPPSAPAETPAYRNFLQEEESWRGRTMSSQTASSSRSIICGIPS